MKLVCDLKAEIAALSRSSVSLLGNSTEQCFIFRVSASCELCLSFYLCLAALCSF